MSQSVRLLSYNIRTSALNEADCSDELNNWKYRKSAIFSLIQMQSPHIFGIQEDSKEQLIDLTEVFSSEYNIVAFEESVEEENEECNAIFVSKSFDLIETGFRFISDTPHTKSKLPDSICYRHLTFIRARIEWEICLIVNVHLDHSEDYNFKHREAQCFINILKELNVKNTPIILMGDFNLTADNNMAYSVIAGQFSDVSKIFGVREPTHPNWLMWNVYKQLDYFWVSKDLERGLEGFRILKDRYTRVDGLEIEPSDHFPVKITLNFFK